MTSPSNNRETPSQNDNNQHENMTPEQSASRPASPHTPHSSDRTHASSEPSPKASQNSSCTSGSGHSSPVANVTLASSFILSRYLATSAQNPFFSLMQKELLSPKSQGSVSTAPRSPSNQFSPHLSSSHSSGPQSPLISPTISSLTSPDKERTSRDVEMAPSPISPCTGNVKDTTDVICAKTEPTSESKSQNANDGDVDMKTIDPCQTDNSKQESKSTGTLAGKRTCADIPMKDCRNVSPLPSSIVNSPPKSSTPPEILLKKRLIRGLQNNGNTCFINSILQSLMSCDLFRELALSEDVQKGTLLEKFSFLAREMTEEASPKSMNNDFSSDAPLLPKRFFGIFRPAEAIADKHSGTQEDAEEFLSFMLNQLQDQEVAQTRDRPPCTKTDACQSGWQSGVKGQRFVDTNISNIFGGSSVSEVRRTCQTPSLTEASFFSLSLDVDLDSVNSISDALNNYCATEVISDGMGEHGIGRIEKQVFLTVIPKILILHLKRFAYDAVTLAPKKVMKEIKFPELLQLPDVILRRSEYSCEGERSYRLMAAVTHMGPTLTGGHYYCDVRFRKTDGSSIWVRCSDEVLRKVELEEVLRRDAYLLFYCEV